MRRLQCLAILVLGMAMLQACATSAEYVPEGPDRIWSLDTVIIDCGARVESTSGTYIFEAGSSKIAAGPQGATLTLIGNRENEDKTAVFRVPVGTIRRIWYETALHISLKDEGERILQPGEWCMEVDQGRVVSIFTKAGNAMSGGGEYISDADSARFHPEDISSLEVPITGWQALGNIFVGILIAIPSLFVFWLLLVAGVFNFSF